MSLKCDDPVFVQVHGYHSLRVIDIVRETADCRSFVFEIPSDLTNVFSYVAGQFCTIRATIGHAEVVRKYSMSSSPDTGEKFAITVKRAPGGIMSNWMIDSLSAGCSIDVTPPGGHFLLRESSLPIVAIAGGIGIGPVISVLKSALAITQRKLTLIYFNRDADTSAFFYEIERLRHGSDGRFEAHQYLYDDLESVDIQEYAALLGDRSNAEFYVCGASTFTEKVEVDLKSIGVSRENVLIEPFGSSTNSLGPDSRPSVNTVQIQINHTVATLECKFGDTVLESARRATLDPPFSCRAGNCGTCKAFVESGSATMRRNNALAPRDVKNGWVLTCQAVPTSPTIMVNYDARLAPPGMRWLIKKVGRCALAQRIRSMEPRDRK